MDTHDLTAAYALDALDADERTRYERHLAGCERCREELRGLSDAAAALGRSAAGPPPPAALRNRILEEARRDRATVLPFRRRGVVPVLSAAAAVAAVAAIGVGIWAASLARELDDLRDRAGGERSALAVLADPNRVEVPLEGAEGRLLVASSGRAALVLSGVEPAPPGKTYEIWVIEGGVPQPAGLFRAAQTRTVLPLSRPVPEDAVVAVTLEPAGGVDAPTGAPLFSGSTA